MSNHLPVVRVEQTQQAVSQGRMGYGEICWHTFMVCMTGGLWLIKVASRRRQLRTVTRYR